MNIFKSFGLKKAPLAERLERQGWGPGAMSAEDRREMEGRDESYGDWVNRRIEERAKKQEDAWKKKFAEEGHTMPKRFENRPIDEVLEDDYMIDEDKKWADEVALEQPESGEGISVKGRGLPKKYYGDKPRPSAEGEAPGRTDFLDEKQYTKRPKGQTLADKRAGRAVLNMFKAFGINKEGGKKTPGGPDLQTDPVTGEISVVPDPEEDENGEGNGD